jgi:hypothetical protein
MSEKQRSIGRVILEVVLIAVGVFFGMAAQQWNDVRHERELARATLVRFRTEIAANRKAVEAVRAYHADASRRVQAYLEADAAKRRTMDMSFSGLRPVGFEHTAWDLALAMQSLTYVDQDLAFELARIYNAQRGYDDLARGMIQAMYVRPPNENLDAFLKSVEIWLDDVVIQEPEIVKLYDRVLPQLDSALGNQPGKQP